MNVMEGELVSKWEMN